MWLSPVGALIREHGPSIAWSTLKKKNVSFGGALLHHKAAAQKLFKQACDAGFGRMRWSDNATGPKALYFDKKDPSQVSADLLDAHGVTMDEYKDSYAVGEVSSQDQEGDEDEGPSPKKDRHRRNKGTAPKSDKHDVIVLSGDSGETSVHKGFSSGRYCVEMEARGVLI